MEEREKHVVISAEGETRELGVIRESEDGPHGLLSIHVDLPDEPDEAPPAA